MKTFAKMLFGAASVVAMYAGPALADDDHAGFSGYVAFTTDYRFRGITQSDHHAAAQGSINWAGPEGFYAGAWASGVDFNDASGTNVELDLYGGKHFDLGGTDLNLEAYYYAYPDAASGSKYSYFEGIAGLTHSFESFSLGASAAWSPEFFGHTGTAFWVGGNLTVPLVDWLSFSGNVGHQWIDLGTDYTHWDAGLTATYAAYALDLRYYGTDISSPAKCGGTTFCKPDVNLTLTWNIPG